MHLLRIPLGNIVHGIAEQSMGGCICLIEGYGYNFSESYRSIPSSKFLKHLVAAEALRTPTVQSVNPYKAFSNLFFA